MSNYIATPSTFPTATKITVGKLADWEALLDALTDDMVPYVPTFSATSFALGNGVLTGFYKQIGKMVDAFGSLVIGSTTNLGSTAWSVALPVSHNVGTGGPLGIVECALTSGGNRVGGWCWANGATSMGLSKEDGTRWAAAVPIAFASGSEIRWWLRYRST